MYPDIPSGQMRHRATIDDPTLATRLFNLAQALTKLEAVLIHNDGFLHLRHAPQLGQYYLKLVDQDEPVIFYLSKNTIEVYAGANTPIRQAETVLEAFLTRGCLCPQPNTLYGAVMSGEITEIFWNNFKGPGQTLHCQRFVLRGYRGPRWLQVHDADYTAFCYRFQQLRSQDIVVNLDSLYGYLNGEIIVVPGAYPALRLPHVNQLLPPELHRQYDYWHSYDDEMGGAYGTTYARERWPIQSDERRFGLNAELDRDK